MNAIIGGAFLLLSTPLSLLYSMVGIVKTPGRWKRFIPFYVFSLALVAYSYTPINEPDLYRYFQMLESLKGLTLSQAFEFFKDGLLVKNSVFWIIAQLNCFGLLPMLSTAIVYGVATYITCDMLEHSECIKIIPRVLTFQFMMLPFISIINNVRNISAFALICLAAYQDLIKRKKSIGVLLLYILPCLIHEAALVLLLLRIAMIFTRKMKILTFSMIWLSPVLIEFGYANRSRINIGGSLGILIHNAILKTYWYLHDESDYALNVSTSLSGQLTRLSRMFLAVFFVALIFLLIKRTAEKYRKFMEYHFLINVMVLTSSIFASPHYWRFSAASVVCIAAVLVPMYQCWGRTTKVLNFLLFGMAFAFLFLQIWSAQYITDFADLAMQTFINNVYMIGWNILSVLV